MRDGTAENFPGGERGEMRQRRGRRQHRREAIQLFPGGGAHTGRGRRRSGLAVDGVVEVDGVQRLVDKPPVDGHADLRKNYRVSHRLLDFGWVDFYFGYSTVSLILPKHSDSAWADESLA